MSNAPRRLSVKFADATHNFRVQAHRGDATLLVVKSPHPEALDAFAMATGADIGVGKSFKGSHYFITLVDKVKFSAALAAFCAKMEDSTPVTPAVDPAVAEYDAEGEDEESEGAAD